MQYVIYLFSSTATTYFQYCHSQVHHPSIVFQRPSRHSRCQHSRCIKWTWSTVSLCQLVILSTSVSPSLFVPLVSKNSQELLWSWHIACKCNCMPLYAVLACSCSISLAPSGENTSSHSLWRHQWSTCSTAALFQHISPKLLVAWKGN